MRQTGVSERIRESPNKLLERMSPKPERMSPKPLDREQPETMASLRLRLENVTHEKEKLNFFLSNEEAVKRKILLEKQEIETDKYQLEEISGQMQEELHRQQKMIKALKAVKTDAVDADEYNGMKTELSTAKEQIRELTQMVQKRNRERSPSLSRALSTANGETEKIRRERDQMKAELSERIKAGTAISQAARDEYLNKIKSLQDENIILKKSMECLEVSAEKLEGDYRNLKSAAVFAQSEEKKFLETRLDEAFNKVEDYKAEAELLRRQLCQTELDRKRLANELQLNSQESQSRLREIDHLKRTMEKESKVLTLDLDAMGLKVIGLEDEKRQLLEERKNHGAARQAFDSEVQMLRRANDQLLEESTQAKHELKELMGQSQKEIQALKTEISAVTHTKSSEQNAFKGKCTELANNILNLEDEIEGLKLSNTKLFEVKQRLFQEADENDQQIRAFEESEVKLMTELREQREFYEQESVAKDERLASVAQELEDVMQWKETSQLRDNVAENQISDIKNQLAHLQQEYDNLKHSNSTGEKEYAVEVARLDLTIEALRSDSLQMGLRNQSLVDDKEHLKRDVEVLDEALKASEAKNEEFFVAQMSMEATLSKLEIEKQEVIDGCSHTHEELLFYQKLTKSIERDNEVMRHQLEDEINDLRVERSELQKEIQETPKSDFIADIQDYEEAIEDMDKTIKLLRGDYSALLDETRLIVTENEALRNTNQRYADHDLCEMGDNELLMQEVNKLKDQLDEARQQRINPDAALKSENETLKEEFMTMVSTVSQLEEKIRRMACLNEALREGRTHLEMEEAEKKADIDYQNYQLMQE